MKVIDLALQAYLIQNKNPNWSCKLKRNKMEGFGKVQPTELSMQYLVKIVYTLGKTPELIVVDPPLEKNSKDESSPHLYEGDLLCVYHPSKNEWDSSKVIADTIIPWISLWLYYYEIWLATGAWKGGGDHPTKTRRKKNRR